MDREKESKALTIALSISLIVVLVLGVTYAYFTARIEGNDTAKATTVHTGNLDITFTTTQYIKNTNAMLIKDSERETKADFTEFKVKHSETSTVPAKYQVYLTEITISDNFKTPDVKWELLKNDSPLSNGDFSSIGNATTILLTPAAQDLPMTNEDVLVLRVWLSETEEDQISLTSGSIRGRVMVEAANIPG